MYFFVPCGDLIYESVLCNLNRGENEPVLIITLLKCWSLVSSMLLHLIAIYAQTDIMCANECVGHCRSL